MPEEDRPRLFTMIQRRSSPSVRIGRSVRSCAMQGRGLDLRRSTVDLDFTYRDDEFLEFRLDSRRFELFDC